MQITIVQAEIEKAIEQYVLSQLTVREGQKVTIDLKATRGDTGFQAIIDIVPITMPKGASSNVTALAGLKATPKAVQAPVITTADLKRMRAEEEAQEAAQAAAQGANGSDTVESPEEDTPVEAPQHDPDNEVAIPDPAPAPVETPAAPAAAGGAKRLFAGFSRPTNQT